MARLAVMANFDPEGGIGPHVRRQVEALAAGFEDVVVVSTSELTESSRDWLRARVRLIERANYGYDFFSYKAGLESVPEATLQAYDEVVLCNDSYVGPLRDYARILEEMSSRDADFWGLTETDRVAHHVQSFFVAFRPWTVGSQAFRGFWSGMEPLSDRMKVIRRYEVGMSTTLYAAGLRSASYFVESDADRAVARERVEWWAAHRGALRGKANRARH
ncbi:MAG: rhamnan synthesis F family protein, partial [Nocardioides sp.]|uniref:rhamnan synthesis F family protein n=1 Tax=Nocardioides sp. TaxID=35761 RepID=UPI0039E66173